MKDKRLNQIKYNTPTPQSSSTFYNEGSGGGNAHQGYGGHQGYQGHNLSSMGSGSHNHINSNNHSYNVERSPNRSVRSATDSKNKKITNSKYANISKVKTGAGIGASLPKSKDYINSMGSGGNLQRNKSMHPGTVGSSRVNGDNKVIKTKSTSQVKIQKDQNKTFTNLSQNSSRVTESKYSKYTKDGKK